MAAVRRDEVYLGARAKLGGFRLGSGGTTPPPALGRLYLLLAPVIATPPKWGSLALWLSAVDPLSRPNRGRW